MGCDIVAFAEKREGDKWVSCDIDDLFDFSSHVTFAFLAGVRNYNDIIPLDNPRGIPRDASERVRYEYDLVWKGFSHSPSWLSLRELLSVNYDARMAIYTGPYALDDITLRHLLHGKFFSDLERMEKAGAERCASASA